MGQDPSNNPKIPLGAMIVGNNADGTFTVSSTNHLVTIGTPSAAPRKGRRGGIVVAGLMPDEKLPPGTISVRDPDELADKLKSAISAAAIGRAAARGAPKEVHFLLKGQHTLDLSKLPGSTGESPVLACIHMDLDPNNPKIPIKA